MAASDGGDEVDVRTVASAPIAVRDARVTRVELGVMIPRLLDDVWEHIRAHGDMQPGHNLVVYRGDPGAGPADIEVGVQISRRFEGTSPAGVRCSELPGGQAVHATHHGPYDGMARAYERILAWEQASDREFGGVSWEIYGDWSDDEALLETDIFFLLRP